jgi:hypothetical protein
MRIIREPENLDGSRLNSSFGKSLAMGCLTGAIMMGYNKENGFQTTCSSLTC